MCFRENLDLFKPSIFQVREVIEDAPDTEDSMEELREDVDGVTASTEVVDLSDPTSLKKLVQWKSQVHIRLQMLWNHHSHDYL